MTFIKGRMNTLISRYNLFLFIKETVTNKKKSRDFCFNSESVQIQFGIKEDLRIHQTIFKKGK